MKTLFLKLFLIFGESLAYPRYEQSAISFHEYQQLLEHKEIRIEALKQAIVTAKEDIENYGKIQPIYIHPDYFGIDQTRGYGFKVQFKSDILDVFLFQSDVMDVGYLLITGPDSFTVGFKWSTTIDFYGHISCTKEMRSTLSKILEVIADVKIKPRFGKTKANWINGETSFDLCLPILNFKLKIEAEFVPEAFDGLGMQLTKKEIEKIENMKQAYESQCQTEKRRMNC